MPHLMGFVEEQAEVGKNNPEFLPAVAVFELSEQVARELVLSEAKEQTLPTEGKLFKHE